MAWENGLGIGTYFVMGKRHVVCQHKRDMFLSWEKGQFCYGKDTCCLSLQEGHVLCHRKRDMFVMGKRHVICHGKRVLEKGHILLWERDVLFFIKRGTCSLSWEKGHEHVSHIGKGILVL